MVHLLGILEVLILTIFLRNSAIVSWQRDRITTRNS
jgi:hypothetical protein